MPFEAPASVLVVGSGVFGLGTAEALCRRAGFAQTTITVVDRGSGGDPGADDDDDDDGDAQAQHFPARDAASIDSSRIIRADYADPAYAALAAEAQAYWRGTRRRYVGDADDDDDDDADDADDGYIGGGGRYTESGLVLVADAAPPADQPADRAPVPGKKKKTGMDYVRESWANVQALAADDAYLKTRLQELPSRDAIRAAVGTGGVTGDWGYRNGASGWADAAASMAWMLRRVRAAAARRQQQGAVRFVRGRVAGLAVDPGRPAPDGQQRRVTGVRLDDGRCLSADLVVLAAGAWTEPLLRAAAAAAAAAAEDAGPPAALPPLLATGQALGYVPLASAAEHARVAAMPVVLNLTTGLFVIPPAPHSRELKVARHAYGYVNPSPSSSSSAAAATSSPITHLDDPSLAIPAEGAADLRRGLRQMVPPLPPADDDRSAASGSGPLAERPFARTRLCWYTDTPTGDFLVDYHPGFAQSLFVATGGSGHGFKFLPVLGDRIVDCIVGNRPAAFREKWAWRGRPATEGQTGAASPPGWASVVTEDGSRGGRPGLILRDELAK